MSWTLVSTSAIEPITLAQASAHLKMTGITDDDTLITALISSARDVAEKITGRELVQKTWTYTLDQFPRGLRDIWIEKAPLVSVASIEYLDGDGATQTLSTSVYGVNADPTHPKIYLKYGQTWPTSRNHEGSVTITLTTGYPASGSPLDYRANIPKSIIAAIYIILRDLYDNRGSAENTAGAQGSTAWNLLHPYHRRMIAQ